MIRNSKETESWVFLAGYIVSGWEENGGLFISRKLTKSHCPWISTRHRWWPFGMLIGISSEVVQSSQQIGALEMSLPLMETTFSLHSHTTADARLADTTERMEKLLESTGMVTPRRPESYIGILRLFQKLQFGATSMLDALRKTSLQIPSVFKKWWLRSIRSTFNFILGTVRVDMGLDVISTGELCLNTRQRITQITTRRTIPTCNNSWL